MPQFLIHGPSGFSVSQRVDGERILIGRSSVNDLVLPSRAVSRRHAEIRHRDEGWWIEDLGSRHGTSLNGRPLKQAARLSVGDEFTVGPARIVVETLEDSGADEEATATASDLHISTVSSAPSSNLVGGSKGMRRIRSMIAKVAASRETILITGETGTGKELVARLIHEQSPRRKGPFTVVNCPALPSSLVESELFGVATRTATGVDPRAGLLETADGGTLFLDEVGDLDVGIQAKLLRFMDDKTFSRVGSRSPIRVDTRILAATNRDLREAMEHGGFRRDLYHRLNTVAITVPPLRERREDIPGLVEHFLSRGSSPRLSLDEDALRVLQHYDFPGNVRELERILTRVRLFAEGTVVTPSELPELDEQHPAEGAAASPEAIAQDLLARITEKGESFWEVVKGPYLRRTLTPEAVRRLVELAYEKEGRSKRRMARAFRMHDDKEYKKLVAFLRNHRLL